MKLARPREEWLLWAAFFFAGCIASWMFRERRVLSLRPEVDGVAALTLLLGIAVSVGLFRRLEKVKHSDQLRKTVLLGRLDDLMSRLEAVENLCENDRTTYDDMRRTANRCRRASRGHGEYAASLDCRVHPDTVSKLESACDRIWRLTTETSQRSAPVPQLSVVGLYLRFHTQRLTEVESAIDTARDYVYALRREVIDA